MKLFIGVALILALVSLVVYFLRKPKRFLPMPNGQMVEVDPDDPTDPMHDEAVRAMMSEVIRTGRPMAMNRGEAPRFIDEVRAERTSTDPERSES